MPARHLVLPLLLVCAWQGANAGDAAADGDWAVELGRQLERLERQPADRQARHAAWRAATRLGLYEQAAALDAPLSNDEQRTQEGDRITLLIRYGSIDANTLRGADRFARLDQALAAAARLAGAVFAGSVPDAEALRQLVDRLAALAARRRPAEALALYDALRARALPVPVWALPDLADSYLKLRQPDPAIELYRRVLAVSPDDYTANLGLFYALSDAGQPAAAIAHIDAFAARLPERRHRDGKINGERLNALIASDRGRLYADRLAEAEQRITARRAGMPFNSEARSAAAGLALARGWPRQGEEMLLRVLGADPGNTWTLADLAEVNLQLQDWPAARRALASAEAIDADSPGVRRARESVGLHDRYEFSTDAGYGKGSDSSGFFGNSDWRVDSFLYSRPLAESWRIFAHHYLSRADFDGDTTQWSRGGIGAEWRQPGWRLSGEITGGSNAKTGFSGTARWQPDDYWTVYAAGESVSNQISLRGVRDGVSAARAELGVDRRWHESRSIGVSAAQTDFSDDNRRSVVNAAWFERWLSAPGWVLDTRLGADASHNRGGQNVSYFNPTSDRSIWLTATAEQLVWRAYGFRQKLSLTGGVYAQEGFGQDSTEAIEYGHTWGPRRDFALGYSIGRALRPYDGVREARNFAAFNLLWRF